MNNRLLLTAAILLAFILFGLIGTREETPAGTTAESPSPLEAEYDYYMSGMVLDRFTPDGKRSYRITSDQVTHYPTGDNSILDNPAMIWLEAERSPWLLTARGGALSPDPVTSEDRLVLQDQVVAESTTGTGKALTITTESLNVMPASKEISTEALVVLDSNGTHLSSKGMQADLEQDHINLLNGVSGHHE